MVMPNKPCSPALRHSARGTMPSSSHFMWKGVTSFSKNRRQVSRNIWCSGV
jgi:hypothetical protein